jgi:hypothetical protein
MQHPGREVSSSLRNQRTQPTLPGATLPTVPVVAQPASAGLYEPRVQSKKHYTPRHALFQLFLLGTLLEVCWLALYPLLAAATPPHDIAKQALLGLFPWLPQLYWTTKLPFLNSWLAGIPFFQPTSDGGRRHLLFLLVALSFALTLLAGITSNRVMKVKPSGRDVSTLFSTILLFTILFGITFVFAAPVLSQDMFLYGTYGRLVTVYHINPYTALLSTFPHDLLHAGLPKDMQGRVAPGPIWIDLSLPVVLLARDSVANALLGFRLLGLLAYLANAALLWLILARLKPTARLFATLLYAWNPLVLLLSVSDMHLDVVLLLVLFLAILFFQRKSLFLSWVFLLLAVLINPLSLLLLPFFLRLLSRENSRLPAGRRVWWWLSMSGLSIGIIVLAYAPYWQSWGLNGLLTSIRQSFLPDTAINSFDMALLKLPIKFSPALIWLLTPQHWILFAVITVVCILLLGICLADTLELVLLFSSSLMLALLILFPIYWPWYVLVPLGLALCSANNRTILLATLLTMGALSCWYFWLWQPVWSGLALITVGFPLLIWGWLLFFRVTWLLTRPPEPTTKQRARQGLSRPSRPLWAGNTRSWPSRPSWPTRR